MDDFNWHDRLGVAYAETSKFNKKQEWGKFRYDELLSVAVKALAGSPGVAYARIAIHGALTDYVRDRDKIVHNVELTEGEYLRTRGGVPEKKARKPKARPVFFKEHGVWGTVYSKGRYRTNEQLLRGYEVSSKHNKVSVALVRTTYNDEWSQIPSGWKRAKIDDDEEDRNHDPRAGRVSQRGEVQQDDYKGRGRQKRFSNACVNNGEDFPRGLKIHGWEDVYDGKVKVSGLNRKLPAPLRRTAVAPKLDVGIPKGRWRKKLAREVWQKYGLEPVPKDKLGRWREELAMEPTLRAGSSLVRWQREAGYFRPGREDCGVPESGVHFRYRIINAVALDFRPQAISRSCLTAI